MKIIFKIFNYFENLWVGDDGKISGKRVCGYILVYKAIQIAEKAIDRNSNLADAAILSSTLLGAALVFWGITTYKQLKSRFPFHSNDNDNSIIDNKIN